MRFQWQSVLFFYNILMMVGFVPLDLNSSQFRSFTRFQWQSVLFFLRDFSDGWFCFVTRFQWLSICSLMRFFFPIMRFQWQSVLFSYEVSMTVIFFWVMRFQWQSVLFFYEISVTVGFVQLRDFNDYQFSMRSRSQNVMFWSFTEIF